jgi:hypothetical protein
MRFTLGWDQGSQDGIRETKGLGLSLSGHSPSERESLQASLALDDVVEGRSAKESWPKRAALSL